MEQDKCPAEFRFILEEMFKNGISGGKGENTPFFLKSLRTIIEETIKRENGSAPLRFIFDMRKTDVLESAFWSAIKVLSDIIIRAGNELVLENLESVYFDIFPTHGFLGRNAEVEIIAPQEYQVTYR